MSGSMTGNGGGMAGNATPSTLSATSGSIAVNSLALNRLEQPMPPTVTTVGTAGATSYTYALLAVDTLGNSTGLGATTVLATGNATLSATNYNAVSWTAIAGAVTTQVWRTASGGAPSTTGLIGTLPGYVTSFSDTGLVANGATAPTYNYTGVITIGGVPAIQFASGQRGVGSGPDAENTLIGYGAGPQGLLSSSCIEATMLGYMCGGSSAPSGTGLQGARNTGMGFYALASLTTGTANVGVGNNAMDVETTGSYNTFVGSDAGRFSLGNQNVVALGCQALYNASATNSIVAGMQCGYGASGATISNSILLGNSIFQSAAFTSAAYNIIIGYNCFGTSTTSPSENVSVGCNIAVNATNPANNTMMGHGAVQALTSGSNNAAFGQFSLRNVSTGGSNSTFGQNAGDKITTGGNNTVIGNSVASTTLTTGSSNILIGTGTGVDTPAAGTSNYMNIGGVLINSGLSTPSTSITYAAGGLGVSSTGPTWTSGAGAPASTQPAGSLYSNTSGGTGTRLYVSAGGGTWAAVAGV